MLCLLTHGVQHPLHAVRLRARFSVLGWQVLPSSNMRYNGCIGILRMEQG
jgi:hypothetical protein